ncbi:hypothetical protein B4W72_02815 [Staphylococcus delphini]|nr:hypothetical protein B4W72_02815 [Staphylococcus delphini]QUM68138.1 hypothetical protein IPU21_05115 [Staphylococcus delphini]
MKLLGTLALSSVLLLTACGKEDENKEKDNKTETTKKEEKKEKKTEDKKENKEEKTKEETANNNQQNNEQQDTQVNEQQQSQQQANQASQQELSVPSEDKNTVTEYYNGQSHTTTNNPVRDNYTPGETDPIYEREYKHYYTPEEAQRAQEVSDRILIEDGLEPGHYE